MSKKTIKVLPILNILKRSSTHLCPYIAYTSRRHYLLSCNKSDECQTTGNYNTY